MPTISGSLHDVTGHSTTAREVLVRAKFLRASAGTVTTTETRQIAVSNAGEVSFDCEPGPAVMLVVYAKGAPLEVPLVVGPESSSLGDVADAAAVADDIDRGRLEDLARELVALAHQVRSDRNDVAGWHPQIEGWHSDVDGWQEQVATDRQIAHDASALAVLAAANAGRIMGTGSPEGVKDAPVGTIYVNTANGELWNKTTVEGSTSGWKLLGAPDASALWWKPRLTSANDLNDVRGPAAVGVYPVAGSVVNGPGVPGWITVTYDANSLSTKQAFTPSSPTDYMQQERVYQGSWGAWRPTTWRAGNVTASTDVNTVIDPGVYTATSGNAPNLPIVSVGTLEVFAGASGGYRNQRFTATSSTSPRTFIRSLRGSSWSGWVELTDTTTVAQMIAAAVDPGAATWYKARLTSTSNLDEFIGSSAVGLYPVAWTVGGSPTGTAGWVEITYDSNANRTKQRFTPSSPSEYTDWERVYQGSWRPWRISSWNAGFITGSGDLNTYTTPGVFGVTSGSAANTPVNHVGSLEILPGGSGINNVVQRFTSTVNGRQYSRTMFAGGAWSAWQTLVDSTQVAEAIDAALAEFTPPSGGGAVRPVKFTPTEAAMSGGSATVSTWSWDRRVGYNSLSPNFRQTRDYGQTWEDVRSFSGMNVEWSKGLPNGEIMVETTSTVNGVSGVRRIWVSTGYDRLNPAAATWEVTLTAAAPLVKFAGWSIHISEEMILLNEYGPKSGMVWGSGSENIAEGQNARYTYRSFDNGKTWETIFDLNAWLLANGRPNADGQHLHGVAFDKYWDRIWISFGDAANSTNGVIFSDDDGATWQAAQWTHTNPGAGFQVVGITPMKGCVLFAGDMTPSGCMSIDRSQGKHGGSYSFATAFEYDVNQKHLCHWIEHFENPSGETAIFAFAREGTASKSFILATRDGVKFDVIWESQGADSPGIRTLAGPSKRGHLVAGVSASSGWYEVRGNVDCY